MKLKNYFIIFCLFMVLIGCVGTISAASDDTMDNGESGIGIAEDSIPVINDNQANEVDNLSASDAQSEYGSENSIQSPLGDDNSPNKLSESEGVEFYVSTQGSDDNPGTQDSPFLTINKAISSADASKNTIIYIGAGKFSGTLNTNLQIDVNRGSSITIIGENGKTVIDGENSNRFIASIGANSNVIIKNIYINNTRPPISQNGGAINANGALTIENCIFNNTCAIYENMGGRVYGGAIYSLNSLTVINSTFENAYTYAPANSYGGAIAACYASGNVEIINNTFINCKSTSNGYGSAVYSYAYSNTKISGNKFINITATQNAWDAGLYVMGFAGNAIEVTDNTFENCNNLGTNGAVMSMTNYVSSYSGNKFINSSSYAKGLVYTTSYNFDFIVNINDVTTTKPTFLLSANVTDIDGNSLSFGTSLQFFINGESVGTGPVNAGISTVEVSKLYDNGEYKITAKLNGVDKPSWRNGTLTVNIGRTPVDIWVDAENGADVETAGNKTNPFKSIKYAIEQGLVKSIYPTIHIKNGVYSGENNTNLVVDSLCEIAFIGETPSATIIDGEGSNPIFTLTQDGAVTFKNISFINAKSTTSAVSFSSRTVTVDNCIFKNCTTTGRGGAIYAVGTTALDCTITNTEFLNCSGTSYFSSAFWIDGFNKIVFENNSIVNSSQKWNSSSNPSRGAGHLSGQTVLVSNNQFINNSAIFGYDVDLYFNSRVSGIANNNTFINSQGSSRVQSSLIFSECRGDVSITNNKFINDNLTARDYYYGILYLDRANFYLENNTFINTTKSIPNIMVRSGKVNGKIVILNKTISSNIFNLTAYITDIDGNPIQCKNIYFYIEDEEIGQADSVNGVATLDCLKYLSDGEYTINCSCTYLQDVSISTGTLKVNIPINPKEYYISASAGDDENGDGTKAKPFKTLKKALDQSLVDHSYDITINVMDGTYSGEGNVNLALNNSFAGVLKIIGENYNKTIFDGNENAHMFWINDNNAYGIPSTLKVSIENITFTNFAYDENRGSLIQSDAAELNLTSCIFDSIYAGSRCRYPVIYQRNDLNIKDSIFKTITNEYAGIVGGYVQSQYQTITLIKIDNCTFIDCISGYSSIVDAVTQLSNSTFENCSSQRDRQEISIVTSRSNATFVNNKFINNVASGGVLLNYDVATVINNTFIDNTISYIAPINSYSDLIIIDSKFINNTGVRAGVIYTDSSLNLTNNVFENNKQGSKLNDINAESGAKISGLTLTISNIDSNQLMNDIVAELSSADGAIVTGGQIEFYANETSLGKTSLINNNAFITYTFANDGKYVLNATYNMGGDDLIVKTGIAIINTSPVEFNELYVSDSKGDDINGNGSISNPFKTIKKAVYYSAGHDNVTIHVLEGIYKGMENTNIKIDTSKLTIIGEGKDKTIIDGENNNYFFNIAKGNIVFSNLTFINGLSSTITIAQTASLVLDNIKYENNTRESGNGIITSGSLTITDSEFYNNGNTKESQSGIIYAGRSRDTIIKIYNSKFVNSVGTYASVIYTLGEISIDNCIFSNSGNSRYVIYNNNQNALVNVTSSVFTDNLATCIYGKVYVVNSNFTNNYAINSQQTSGGAIYSTNAGYVSNCIFTNNSATMQGGAMYFYGEIYNSEFYNNTASINNGGAGGAIYLASYSAPSTIVNCYFEGNKALMGRGNDLGGGAIYVRGQGTSSKITITSCNFVNNSAIDSAGAIRNYGGYTTISDSEFINNHAEKNGGAVSTSSGSATIVNSKFINNTADAEGGAIEIYRSIPTIIDNCLFEENTALNGGAIVRSNTETIISNSNFTKNNALSSGGAIKDKGIGSSRFSISKSIFIANNASTGGAMDGTCFSVSYCVFVNNTAESGSGVYSSSFYMVDLQDNNWWGINDNPNQFISSGYEIETWVIANILPNITNIVAGENKTFTVYFTNNTGGELTDFIPIRPIVVYDDSYNLEKNNATINVLAKTGTMTISVDNEIFEFNVENLYDAVTNSTFSYFFDENGTLNEYITVDNLKFEGEFSNLGVDAINITRPITLTGNNTVLEDIGLIISADNVTVDNFEIKLSNESNATAAITVLGDDVTVKNSNINVDTPEDKDSFAVLVEGAEDFALIGNTIKYIGNTDGSATNNAILLEDADGAVIEDNTIDMTLSSVPVTYTPPTWEATVLSEGIVVDSSDDVVLSNNEINVDYNKVTGAYDTIYAVEFKDSDNANISNNEITTQGNTYAYGLTINGEDFTIEENNITTTGNNYANGIQIVGPASGDVTANNINAEAPSVVYPVYSYGTDVTYTDNNISGTSNSVYAMELFGTNETVKDNNIVANGNFTIGVASGSENLVLEGNNILANGTNEGTPTGGDSITSETTGVKAVSGSTEITNNTITSTSDSAVKTTASGSIVENTLVANGTTGDASVDYTPNQGLIVDGNVPKMEKAIFSAEDIVMYYRNGTRYVVTLTDAKGNPLANKAVTLTVNGVSYSKTTDNKGTASIGLNLNSGEYTATASFAGDGDYGKANAENTITILSTVEGNDLVKVFRNASQYEASFVDGQGNALANTEVTFNINGVMYKKTTDKNGIARLNINLPQGKYIITAINPVNNEMHANNITVLPRIVENNDIVKYYKNGTQYTVKLIGDDGNPVGAGEVVTFNINGVFYNRTTDENGVAQLNINLPPGDYIITADYKGCKVSNNIKVLPVLSAKDLVKKQGGPEPFIAKVLDGQGNPYEGQEVTFNINGVFYHKVTDSNGEAKLNINLPAGEYIITSSYNGVNVANHVTVTA